MLIKSLAYSLSQKLLHPHPIKRTHCHEIIAAAFGFKSYAAITSTGHMIFAPATSVPTLDIAMIQVRAEQLGLDVELLFPALQRALAEHPTEAVGLDELIKRLEYDVPGDSSSIASSLALLADKGVPLASYGLGLIHAHTLYVEAPSDYWHLQRLSGAELSDVELGFADEFLRYQEATSLCTQYLTRAYEHGITEAYWKLVELFDGAQIDFDPIASGSGTWSQYEQHFVDAAAHGDTNAMQGLANAVGNSNPVFVAALVEFARLLDADITQAVASAIDDDGNPYDDDIGGSIHAIITEGVEVGELSSPDQEEALELGSLWFSQLREEGVAKITRA